MGMQKFSQTLAASQSLRMNISGEYFRLGATSYAVTVRFYKGSSVTDEMLLIDGGTWARIEGGFDGFELINSSSGAQLLDVFVGRGEIGIDRILGEVSVINGELSRVKSGVCFIGYCQSVSGVGQYSQLQLFNPVGSPVNVVLNKLIFSSPAVANMGLVSGVVPLAVLIGSGENKKLGSQVSQAKMRSEANAVLAAGVSIGLVRSDGAGNNEFLFSEPLVIAPGYGVFLYIGTNTTLNAIFQWVEEAI